MDETTMTPEVALTSEQECVLYELAGMLMANNRAEAEAVKGYTEQLNVIRKAKEVCANVPRIVDLLNRLEADTEEKTQDELSHGHALYDEYTELTGIVPKED